MTRYHTIDTHTGVIVHQSNRHPVIQPLTRKPRGRVNRSKSFWAKRPLTIQVDPLVAFIIVGIVLTMMLNYGY